MQNIRPMPGKPFRSVLEPYFDEIAQRRARRETWSDIAAELARSHGLKIHFSAIQKFFGRHLARPRPLGFEPLPNPAPSVPALPTLAPAPKAVAPAVPPPVALDGAEHHDGYGGPADPDDENPFLMKKRKSKRTLPS